MTAVFSDAAKDQQVLRRRGGTLAEDLRDELEELIVSGTLPPGSRVDEIELAARYQISRTPVREALKALVTTGFLEARPRHGMIVTSISIPMLLEMFETMAAFEGLCAKLAARRASHGEKAALRAIQQRLSASVGEGNEEAFYAINQEFHELLYEASHTDFISAQTRALRKRLAVYRKNVTFQTGRMAATIAEHERIIQAIEEGNPEAAFRAASEHVSLLGDGMADLIAALPPALLRVS
ncbi:DNA-binding GntR family transcriptional regulator [Bradyrhizobium ottawaense]|uniref:GntR family transcriptional regulator n=1 Tax=Bradyrhizobium ottawaense TaxID=931866 RepID=UPI00383906D1